MAAKAKTKPLLSSVLDAIGFTPVTELSRLTRGVEGRIEEWVSTDRGNTWKKRRDMSPDRERYPGWRFNNVQPVVRPDGSVIEGMLFFSGWKDKEAPEAEAFLWHEI